MFAKAFGWLADIWFRPRVEGWERIPRSPCLFVANHSAYGAFEILVMLMLWVRRFGAKRPVAGLSHDVGFWPPFRWIVVPIGGIRASRAVAKGLLRRGFDVLVFPGGFFDALRPFSARYEVHWNGRAGFLRAAAESAVPIVPLVNCGSHAQYTFLPGGKRLARLLGLTRWRIGSWPIPLGAAGFVGVVAAVLLGAVSEAWLWMAFLAAIVPNPTRMDLKFLPAIDAKGLAEKEAGDYAAAAEIIRKEMEKELQSLALRRVTPWG